MILCFVRKVRFEYDYFVKILKGIFVNISWGEYYDDKIVSSDSSV